MKKTILLLAFAAIGLMANAQDIIVLKDASEIKAKVENISANDITYHKWENIEGPSYTISKAEVLFITYQNGQKEVFRNTAAATTSGTTAAATKANANPRAGKVTFDGYFHGLALADGYCAGPGLDFSLGARIYDYAFVGAEVGFDYFFFYSNTPYSGNSGWFVPVGVNIRAYCPTNGKVYPLASFTVGAAIGNKTVFHCQVLGGIDIGKFALSCGWDRIYNEDFFVFKIGCRFGK